MSYEFSIPFFWFGSISVQCQTHGKCSLGHFLFLFSFLCLRGIWVGIQFVLCMYDLLQLVKLSESGPVMSFLSSFSLSVLSGSVWVLGRYWGVGVDCGCCQVVVGKGTRMMLGEQVFSLYVSALLFDSTCKLKSVISLYFFSNDPCSKLKLNSASDNRRKLLGLLSYKNLLPQESGGLLVNIVMNLLTSFIMFLLPRFDPIFDRPPFIGKLFNNVWRKYLSSTKKKN